MSDTRLGAYLQNRRRALRLTQEQVAQEVGVHQTRVSHWERGSRVPNPDQLQALARLIGVDMETLAAEFIIDNEVELALLHDPLLREDDRRSLITLYRSVTRQAFSGE